MTWYETFWSSATEIWRDGGWAMFAIASIALALFAMGVHIHLRLSETGFSRIRERTWRHWIDAPAEREGPIGRMLDVVCGHQTVRATADAFDQLRASEASSFERDLRVMKICVSAAPLVGLLGTVTGMLATFGALAQGTGGEKTLGMVAAGISEALITTETGLVIAVPGLFFQAHLTRRLQQYKAFLAHVETVCVQSIHHVDRTDEKARVRRAAQAEVARILARRVAARSRVMVMAGSKTGAGDDKQQPERRHGTVS